MKKLFSNIAVVTAMYTVGLVVKLAFSIFRRAGGIRVKGAENLPRRRIGMVVVSNHDDVWNFMAELFAVFAIITTYRKLFFHPILSAPWFTPDELNFMKKWWWRVWLWPRAVPARRVKGNRGVKESRKMRSVLLGNGIIYTQPECGRTRNGRAYQFSKLGRKIRKLADYISWLAIETKTPVLPIWVEDGEEKQPTKNLFGFPNLRRPMVIVIGKLMYPGNMKADEFTAALAEGLLELADQADQE